MGWLRVSLGCWPQWFTVGFWVDAGKGMEKDTTTIRIGCCLCLRLHLRSLLTAEAVQTLEVGQGVAVVSF